MKALAAHWLPTDPPRPCPDLLTEEEAIIFLRLDKSRTRDKSRTLTRYRSSGKLQATQVGNQLCYELAELLRFVEDQRRA